MTKQNNSWYLYVDTYIQLLIKCLDNDQVIVVQK